MKFLFKVALIAIVLIVGYNYFMGTTAEQEKSQKIVDELKDLSNSVKDLIVSEKEKFDEGKYDDVLNKISEQFKQIEKAISGLTNEDKSSIDMKVEEIKKDIEKIQNEESVNSEEENISQKLRKLLDELNELEKKVNSQSEEGGN